MGAFVSQHACRHARTTTGTGPYRQSVLGSCPAARHFSATAMAAQTIDGTAIAKGIRQKLNAEIGEKQRTNPRYKPSLVIIQVGDRPDSTTYIRMKEKAAQEANISCKIEKFSDDISEGELLQRITELNHDPSVHGILVQLPLPKAISEHAITSAVSARKDV